jgi:predicted transcriptional regulator
MHVHVVYSLVMRTTVEITDEQRAKLLHEAAKRGEKGFSGIIQEALDQYFAAETERAAKIDRALRVLGRLSDEEADRLEESIRALRRTWR